MKVTEYRWLTASFALEEGQQQRVTPQGLPSMKPDGTPEMEKVTTLVLIRQTDTEQEILRVPFSDEARQKLVTALSGGIIVADAHDLNKFKL